MKIVELTKRNLKDISNICVDSFLESEHSYYLQKHNLPGLDAFIDFCSVENLAEKMQSKDYIFYGILDENTLVATSCINIVSGKILLLFVITECKGEGYGTMLINYILEVAKNHNLKKVTVDSTHYATSFYETLGFSPISSEKVISGGMIFTPMQYVIK